MAVSERNIIGLAQSLQLPASGDLESTKELLRQRHKALLDVGITREEFIENDEQALRSYIRDAFTMVSEGSWRDALGVGNRITMLAQMEKKISPELGFEQSTFQRLCLRFHQKFALTVLEKFIEPDPKLCQKGYRILVHADSLIEAGNYSAAIVKYRGFVHWSAFKGKLGPEALAEVDPFALVSPKDLQHRG